MTASPIAASVPPSLEVMAPAVAALFLAWVLALHMPWAWRRGRAVRRVFWGAAALGAALLFPDLPDVARVVGTALPGRLTGVEAPVFWILFTGFLVAFSASEWVAERSAPETGRSPGVWRYWTGRASIDELRAVSGNSELAERLISYELDQRPGIGRRDAARAALRRLDAERDLK